MYNLTTLTYLEIGLWNQRKATIFLNIIVLSISSTADQVKEEEISLCKIIPQAIQTLFANGK